MTEQILLVEDNLRDIELALDVIAESGLQAEVVVAVDGEEALDYLYRRGKFRLRRPCIPSLILLDIKTPKVSGFEVLQHLRKNTVLNKIPVLMLTASRQEQDLLAAYELKSDGYLIKPLSFAQFETGLRNARASAASRQ